MKVPKLLMSVIAATLMIPASAFADICSDLVDNYRRRLDALLRDTQAILSQTTDPALQAAIRDSYNLQRDRLVMERDAALASADCVVNVPPPPDIDPPPTEEPPPPPPPPVDDDPVTPPPSEDDEDDEPPVGDDDEVTPPPSSCQEQLDAYAALLRGQNVHQWAFVHKMRAKAQELGCGNYGGWRKTCDHRGGSHGHSCPHRYGGGGQKPSTSHGRCDKR